MISLTLIIAGLLIPWTVEFSFDYGVADSGEIELKVFDHEQLIEFLNSKEQETIIVNFWATWCKPCVEEMPYFQKLSEELNGDEYSIVMVSLDFPNQVESKLKPFLMENPINADHVLLDDSRAHLWIEKFSPDWSGAIPATIVYRNGPDSFDEGKFDSYESLFKFVIN
jgi:thiol-disulfide isomerase/thioredoxin